QSCNTILAVCFSHIIPTIRVAGMRDYNFPSLAIWRTESHFDPSLRVAELGNRANPRNNSTNSAVFIHPVDRLDVHSPTNLLAGTHINSDKDLPELASLDVNLTVSRNTAEVGEFESRPHYLLSIKQGAAKPVRWGP